MVAENPSDHAEFYSKFSNEREMTVTSMGLEINLGKSVIEILTPLAYQFRTGLAPMSAARMPAFAGFRVKVADVARTQSLVESAGVPHARHGAELVVAPEATCGAALIFQGP